MRTSSFWDYAFYRKKRPAPVGAGREIKPPGNARPNYGLVIVRTADLVVVDPVILAPMVAVRLVVTAIVSTVAETEVSPAGMVTVVGTAACVLELDSVIESPPSGAGPFKLTVTCEAFPPTTEVGLRVTVVMAVGTRLRVPVRLSTEVKANTEID